MGGDGFVYMLTGAKHGPQLVVSLASLRDHWSGNVAIIAGDDAAAQVAARCVDDPRLGPTHVVCWDAPRGGGKGLQHANKTFLGTLTPFERTAFLDADTLVTGNPTDLFPDWNNGEVRLSQFSIWKSNERPVRGRVEPWRALAPDAVERSQTQPLPAINTGTLGFSRNSVGFLAAWGQLSRALPRFMSDELVAQIIFPDYPHTILDERWNCLAGDTKVCGEIEAASRSFYRGQMTEIITRAGRRLTATPNHPVFTSRGIVPACQLQISDQLVAHDGQVDLPVCGMSGGYHIQNRPAAIQDLFKAFESGLFPYPTRREIRAATPFDFHGDGRSVQGDIEVIAFQRKLLDDVESCYPEECGYAVFDRAFEQLPVIGCFGAPSAGFVGVDETPASRDGVGCQRRAGRRIHVAEPHSGRGAAVADWDAGGDESPFQNGIGDPVFLGKRLQPLPGNVTSDEVIEIRNLRRWSGHVYDLRTLRGSILANGLYVSNCSPIFSWKRYAPPNNGDVRIWHGHGWKFISRSTGRQIWWPVYLRCLNDNIARLADWTPGADRRLAKIAASGVVQ